MIQIIGRKSCFETKKAMRYLSERGRDFQFVDLSQRDLSRGEWDNIFRCVEPDALIDRNSPYYRKRLVYMEYDPAEELMEHPEIIATPILRRRGRAVAGFDRAFLEEGD